MRALVETIALTRACNQACFFCTFRDAEPRPLPTEDVEQRIDEARARGVEHLRFSGAEPMLDRRLLRFVARAKRHGIENIEVETNATIASLPGVAEKMAQAGVTRVWGALMSADDAQNDGWTGDEGGAARTWAGLERLSARGIALGLSVAVFGDNAPGLAALVDRVGEGLPACKSIRFNVVTLSEGPELFSALEVGLGKACARARKHRIDFRFEPRFAPPPCAFSSRFLDVHTPLYSSYYLSPNSTLKPRERIAACATCKLSDRCTGFDADYVRAHRELLPASPPDREAIAALRGQLGGVDRHSFSQVSTLSLVDPKGQVEDKTNIRVVWACNERCQFCWVDFDWTPPLKDEVLRDLEQLAERGQRRVTFTGGEPLLVPWLEEVVAHSHKLGFSVIELQSNAVHLAGNGRAKALAEGGLNKALISLHSHKQRVSEQITQTAGTWDRTVRGIDALVATNSVLVELSHVLVPQNASDAAEFVDFVTGRWGDAVGIVFSVAAPITPAAWRYDEAILPMDAAGPAVLAGLERALALHLRFSGQNDTCGVPRCVLGNDPRFVVDLPEASAKDSAFVHPEVCAGCDYLATCRGVRREYAERFGGRGLFALKRPD